MPSASITAQRTLNPLELRQISQESARFCVCLGQLGGPESITKAIADFSELGELAR